VRCVWYFHKGLLLVAGSLFSGEYYCTDKCEISRSDIDLLYIGKPKLFPFSNLTKIMTKLEHYCGVKKFDHISLRHICPETFNEYPAWMTNSWIPALVYYSTNISVLQLPATILRPRPINFEETVEAIDFAWLYAVLELTKLPVLRVSSYIAAKLLLVVGAVFCQRHRRWFNCYRDIVTNLSDLQYVSRNALEISYQVKVGKTLDLKDENIADLLVTARNITEALLPQRRIHCVQSTWHLIETLCEAGPVLKLRYRHIIGKQILSRMKALPAFELEKLHRYEAAYRILMGGN